MVQGVLPLPPSKWSDPYKKNFFYVCLPLSDRFCFCFISYSCNLCIRLMFNTLYYWSVIAYSDISSGGPGWGGDYEFRFFPPSWSFLKKNSNLGGGCPPILSLNMPMQVISFILLNGVQYYYCHITYKSLTLFTDFFERTVCITPER